MQNDGKENILNTGGDEATHRLYKRLKLGGGQAYGFQAADLYCIMS
jgi:hypothetical protein